MERLTFDGNFCDIAQCRELPCPYNNACTQRQVWERLKQYEDSGLSPIACEEAKKIEGGLSEHDYSIARMVELMQADKAGRVVVLPCKVGGEVYSTLDDFGRIHQCRATYVHLDEQPYLNVAALKPVDYEGSQYGASFGAFGKTVFLTREEAEKALEAMKDGN
jgi:hypothetical protein